MFKLVLYGGLAFTLYLVFTTGSIWMLPSLWALASFVLFKWGTEKKQDSMPWTGLATKGNPFAAGLVALLGIPILAFLWPVLIIMLCAQPTLEGGK